MQIQLGVCDERTISLRLGKFSFEDIARVKSIRGGSYEIQKHPGISWNQEVREITFANMKL